MMFSISTKGFNDIVDITTQVQEKVKEFGTKDGICLVACPGSTCAITSIEYEPGLINDLKKVLERIAPVSEDYEHNQKWGDGNGYAHIRSALLKPFLSIPIEDGKLLLGTWQQIVFIDFDNQARQRKINVKIVNS